MKTAGLSTFAMPQDSPEHPGGSAPEHKYYAILIN
jgi:hypothetical protein